jgi:hypothetical protein
MKSFYPFAGMLILLLAITPDMVLAQPDSYAGHDSTYLIDFTLFSSTSPLQTDKIIKISLKFDMKKFVRSKHKEEYQKAELTIYNPDSNIVERTLLCLNNIS